MLESRQLLAVDWEELARLLPTADAADTQHVSDAFGLSVAVDGDTAVVGAYSDGGEHPVAGAAYVYTRSGGTWSLQQKLTASDAQVLDDFGYSVAVSGETIVVGAILHDSGGLADSGAAYVFTRSGTTWTEQQKLAAGDAAAGDLFGNSVALDGDTAVVGASSDDTAAGADAGSAYVFVRSGSTWAEQQKLTAPDAAAGDAFGLGLALDGTTAIVGASRRDVGANADAGAAYVFTQSGTTWSLQQTLTSPTGAAGDGFGGAVATNGDVAVIGAYSDDTTAGADAGSAEVWTRSGSVWTQQQQLLAAAGAAGDAFGISVGIDAGNIVVGAFQGDAAGGADCGSAYVFTENGGTWSQLQQLTAADAAGGDALGISVAVRGDTVLAGAFRDDTAAGTDAGSAYFFSWSGSVWSQLQQVYQTDQDARGDTFGTAVSLDGDTLVVGAPKDDVAGVDAGAAYVFTRSGTSWTLQQKLTAAGLAAEDRFGYAVGLLGDTLAVSAPQHDVGALGNAGAVYLFTRSGSTWTLQQTLTAADGAASDYFGNAVSLGAGTLVVGAEGDDTAAGTDAGSAYVFAWSGSTWSQQQKLTASDGAGGDQFGHAVAYDGQTAVIGAYRNDLYSSSDAGSAYVFVRSGSTWTEQQQLTAPFPDDGNLFGSAVAVRGNLAVVSAEASDVGFVPRAGTVYTFTRSGSAWSQQQQLSASEPVSYDRFGRAVAIGEELLVVGADLRDAAAGSNVGSAYVFASGGGAWSQQQELTGSDPYASDTFGAAVAISGLTVAVGSPLADLAGGNSGAVYVFVPDEVQPPTMTGMNPPLAASGVVDAGTRSLAIKFSEAVVGGGDAANYRLQSAGPDALLGTADDTMFPLTVSYSGSTATLTFPAMPESVYRLTVRDTLTDEAGNPLDGDGDGSSGGDALIEFAAAPPMTGVFPSSNEYLTGAYAYPRAVETADFNGDGVFDLVTVNSTGNVTLSLGDGAGGFTPAGTFPSGGFSPWSVTVGDFNGDGNNDLAVANTTSDSVGVLLGNGAGGFSATAVYATGGYSPWDVTVGDFNGDGNTDLAAANGANAGILLGNGAGGFAVAVTYATGGSSPRSVTAEDFNGDGSDDLAIANSSSNTVGILLSDGTGGFNAAAAYASGGSSPRTVLAKDFDGDGDADVAVTNRNSRNVAILAGDGTGRFGTAVLYDTVGSSPDGVISDDFNGDGHADLAVGTSPSVAVLLGTGAGEFAAAVTYTTGGSNPNCVTAGDFNQDGTPDLAVANYTSHNLGVLLGNGSGGFGTAATYSAGGASPEGAASGDFNGDGIADLAVANNGTNSVGVLLGNGAGGFAPAVNFASGGLSPKSVAAGDFNGDGSTDLAVANYAGNNVGVLLGNGAGGFGTARTYTPGGTAPYFVAAGDFNGDGLMDLAVTLLTSAKVGILLADGASGFRTAVAYVTGGNSPVSMALGDFNGDRKVDLAVANSNGGNAGILLGDGLGGFAAAVAYTTGGSYPNSVAVGDFNGDGKKDLAVANSDKVAVLLGNGAGGFGTAVTYPPGSSAPKSVTIGDFNADGRDDVAVLVENNSSYHVSVMLGNGAGALAAGVLHVLGGLSPNSLTLADFNADGNHDLAVTNSTTDNVSILLGRGATGLAAAIPYASGGSNPNSVAVADFNRDGKSDLVVVNYISRNLGVLLGNGAGGFAAAISYGVGTLSPWSATVGDFNLDGKVDVAYGRNGTNSIGVVLGNGAGGFTSNVSYSSGGSSPRFVAMGDFNRDGKSDLAAANRDSDSVGLLLGDGSGGFASPVIYATGGTTPNSVTVGDFNSDGLDDLAVANFGSNSVGVLLGDGQGGFATAVTYSAGGLSAYCATVGDFNADGRDDLAVINYGSDDVGVLLGDGQGGFAAAVAYASGGDGAYFVTTGDFNSDGKRDLAVAHYFSSSFGVLLGDGAGGFTPGLSYASGGVSSPAAAVGDFNADGKDDLAVTNYGSLNVGVFLNTGQYRPSVQELNSPRAMRLAIQSRGFGAGQLVAGAGQAFDGTGRLEVAGQTYAPTVRADFLDNGGRTVVTPTVVIAGLYATREITVPDTGNEDFARTVDVFTNPTAQPITTTVRIVGNLGSDAATTIWRTSDGDTTIEATDQWIGTDDADGTGTPAIIHYIHGPGGLVPTAVSRGGDRGDNIEWTYQITVPAGETVRLAHFTILAETRAAAEAAAATLVTSSGFGGQAATFLTQVELDSVANFAFDAVINADESSANVDNSIVLTQSGSQIVVTVDGVTVLNKAANRLASLTINGQTGNDTLTVDFSGGNPIPAGGVQFDGGDPASGPPGDALVLDKGSSSGLFHTITHTLLSPSDGSISLDPDGPGGTPASVITYTGLEPVSDDLDADNRVFSFMGGAETITLTDVGGGDGHSQVVSTLGESVTFANPTASLTVETTAGTGADAINVEGLDAAFDADFFVAADTDDTLRFQTNPTGVGTGDLGLTAGNIRFTKTLTTTGSARLEALTGSILDDSGVSDPDLVAAKAVLIAETGIDLDLQVGSVEADSGNGVMSLQNAGALTIGGVTDDLTGIVAGEDINIQAVGDLTVSEPVIDTVGAGYMQLEGYTVLINANILTGGSMLDIWSFNDGGAPDDGDMILNAIADSDGGFVYLYCENNLTLNGSLLTHGEDAELRAFGDITFTAAGRIDAEVDTGTNGPLIDLTGGSITMADGSLINARDGELQMLADGNITISSLVADWYVSVFSRNGSILDGGDSDPDVVSETAELIANRAGAVGTAANPLDTQLDELWGKSVTGFYVVNAGPLDIVGTIGSAGGDVQITAVGDLTVSDEVSSGGTVTLSSTGAIVDGNEGSNNIRAANAALKAVGGIGSGNALETQITNLAYHNATGGNVEIANTGGLFVGSVGGLTSSSNAGETTLTASSPITFAADNTQAGLAATAADSGAANIDNLTVNAGVTVTATSGGITFRAGDRIIVNASATVQAAAGSGHVIFESGYADTDDDGAMTLDGAVSAVGNLTLNLNAESGSATQAGTGTITAAGLQLLSSGGGAFDLATSTTNNVATIAASTDGAVAYRDSDHVAVGTVTTAGITTTGDAVTILAPNGRITVDDPVTTTPGTGGEVVLIGRVVLNNVLTPGAGTITLHAKTPPVVTVSSLTTSDPTPIIAGTVSDGALQVAVNSKTYTTGDGNLTVSGTDWTLQIPPGDALPLGIYDVAASATDAAGNTGTDATSGELQIVQLMVSGLASTASGFVVQFNGPVDPRVLNLYDGAGGTLGPADVILQDSADQVVAGSIVVDSSLRYLTFVKTGGVLPPDTYTVTLKSGATAFRDATGSPLDGNRDGTTGDDFTASFTVAASSGRVVSIPDIARGAEQSVNIPNTATGLPIRLDNAAGVTSLAVDLVYDEGLLAITAAALAAGLPGNWSVINPPDTSTPGVAKIRASGTTPLFGTNVEVVRLTAAVPSTAPYGAVQAIRLENVLLNGGEIGAVGDVAVHKAAYLGDADGSGIHSSADAFLTVQAALGLASGFAAHSWTDPRIVGDVDGSGVLSAADAFLIVQEGLGLVEPFVPDNPHITITPVGGGVDPQFQIGVNLPAAAGGQISVPVRLEIEPAATNVGGFDFDLYFAPSLLAIETRDGVSRGVDTSGSWVVTGNVIAAGHLRVVILNTGGVPLAPGVREVAQLLFSVDAGAAIGVTPLDIEPSDPAAGGYTWTASDGSLWIGAALDWHNEANPLDVNGDGRVEPVDALIIINYINAHPGEAALPAPGSIPHQYYDVNDDGDGTAWDVLIVINHLNAQPPLFAEGETPPTSNRTTRTVGLTRPAAATQELVVPALAGSDRLKAALPTCARHARMLRTETLTSGTTEASPPWADRLQDQLFGDAATDFWPLADLLASLADDIDAAWFSLD